ncbi:MAG: hypothetical protein ABSG36_07300 [Acidimicrobiales bacterium]|jgi:hypothetical protein
MRKGRLLAAAAVLGCEAILIPAAAHLVALPASGAVAVRTCSATDSGPWAAEGNTKGATYYDLELPYPVSQLCEVGAYPRATLATSSPSEVSSKPRAGSQLMVGRASWSAPSGQALASVRLQALASGLSPETPSEAAVVQYLPLRVCCEPFSVSILPLRSGTGGANDRLS